MTYNLFRSEGLDELYCAVPEDRAVPLFLRTGAWSFDRKLREDVAPREFDRAAARVGVRFNGFHLFQASQARSAKDPPAHLTARSARSAAA